MKQTEIGLIPDDWEVKSLGEILTIKHGYGFEGNSFSYEDNGFIVVTPGNFKLNGGFQKPQSSIFYVGKYPKEFNLKPNDLVIMMTDLSKESYTLGNPAIIPDDNYQYLHNQRIGLINCNSESFNKNYLFHLLCSKDYHKAVVSTAAGSTVKHTSPKRIYSIKLPITPSLQEQQRIAKALSDVDALISTTEKLIQKKKNIKQGTMQNLLTGKKRLPGFGPQTKSPAYKQTELGPIPDDWEVKSLGEIGYFIGGGTPDTNKTEYWKGSIPWISSSDISKNNIKDVFPTRFITKSAIENSATKICPKNTILIVSRVGVGKLAISKNEVCTSQDFSNFICEQQNVEFVAYQLLPMMQNKSSDAQGTSIKGITSDEIQNMKITLPSKEEQTAIANVLSSMDKEIETLNTKLKKYRNLKTAMMQQLLTGKIRLV